MGARTATAIAVTTAAMAALVLLPPACAGKGRLDAKGPAASGEGWGAAVRKAVAERRAHPKALPPLPTTVKKVGASTQVTYYLDAGMAALVYPNATYLPAPYAPYYPDLISTIQTYTLQSLQRDGYADATVTVTSQGNAIQIQIASSNPSVQGYAEMHVAFLLWSLEGLLGSALCGQCTTCSSCSLCQAGGTQCWDPGALVDADPGQPWAPFLPLGLPLLNQKTVLFLDYPPIPALTGKDYLSNFTMCRWGRVLGGAGAQNPYAYETIVDSRPIAAAGSGQDAFLPLPMPTFDDRSMTTGGYYLTPMIAILSNPLAQMQTASLPVAVFGYTARQTWGQIINYSGVPPVLAVGKTNLAGDNLTTAWISTNHPDVTAYDTCTSDPKSKNDLRESEQIDLVASCWMIAMGASPGSDPSAALAACQGQWNPPASDQNSLAACIQEKTDDNTRADVCCTYADAWAYCTDHGNQACATSDCAVSAATKAKAPPPPPWWADCNPYRGYCKGGAGAPR